VTISTDSDETSGQPLVKVTGLAKAFGATRALRDCSFELRPGQVHALVGENGSGKSTLVKILSGVHTADTGAIEIDGKPVRLRSPIESQRHGVATVFQEVLVAQDRSVYHNVWLGSDGLWRSRGPDAEKRKQASALLDELLGRDVDLGAGVEDLSLSDRQACCIVRALLRQPQVLILDEATSALDVATRDRLFAMIGRIASAGAGIIFITHRMDELTELGDRITVMRSGTTVAELDRGKWTVPELVHLMTGAESLTEAAGVGTRKSAKEREGEVLLSTHGLRLAEGRATIDVQIRAGELIGIAGLEGHGQQAFLEALRGAEVYAGEVMYHGAGDPRPVTSPIGAARDGIVYVPRERGAEATFPWMSIRENFGLPTLGQDTRFGLIQPDRTRRRFEAYAKRLNITFGHLDDQITTLSGGNQQKVIIARWLSANPRVLLLNDPTRGIDVGAKADVYALLMSLVTDGMAVVMLSTEVDEHVELMDRALVFREHEVFREITRAELTRKSLVAAFFGEQEVGGDVPADASPI
jgi:ABC-type sugar transport system ATPase subunit